MGSSDRISYVCILKGGSFIGDKCVCVSVWHLVKCVVHSVWLCVWHLLQCGLHGVYVVGVCVASFGMWISWVLCVWFVCVCVSVTFSLCICVCVCVCVCQEVYCIYD